MPSEANLRGEQMAAEERLKRLESINAFLRDRHLKELRELGDWQNPEVGTELMGITSVYEEPKRFYTVVTFDAKFLGGAEGKYSLIFKASGDVADGSVFVTEIEGADSKRAFVLVDQYKISHGERRKEIIRGFSTIGDADGVGAEDLRSVKVFRELQEEAGVESVDAVKFLGKVMEDSTTSPSDANVYYVKASGVSEAARALEDSEKSSRLIFRSAEEMFQMVRDGVITDMHSLSAIQKAIAGVPHLSEEYAKFLLKKESDFEEPENTVDFIETIVGESLPGYKVEYVPEAGEYMGECFDIGYLSKAKGIAGWIERFSASNYAVISFDRDYSDSRIIKKMRVYIQTRDKKVIGEIKTALKVIAARYPNFPKMKISV